MSKNAVIFHGTGCKQTDFWYSWLGEKLKAKGYSVEIPYYPDISHVAIKDFLHKVLKNHNFDKDTVLVGHSSGSPLILSVLEKIEVSVSQAILVAGYAQELPDDEPQPKDPFIQDIYDWDKIKLHSKEFFFINSTNDPWGCDDKEGRYMFDKLGGTLIIKNEGHFGSGSYNQPYPEFPLLEKLLA